MRGVPADGSSGGFVLVCWRTLRWSAARLVAGHDVGDADGRWNLFATYDRGSAGLAPMLIVPV